MSGDEVRIASVLEAHWMAQMAADGTAERWECECGDPMLMGDDPHIAHVAAALVAAGVGDVATAKAEAWDEGWATGMGDAAGLSNGTADRVTDNPYEASDA